MPDRLAIIGNVEGKSTLARAVAAPPLLRARAARGDGLARKVEMTLPLAAETPAEPLGFINRGRSRGRFDRGGARNAPPQPGSVLRAVGRPLMELSYNWQLMA
jgi:hypothetical protein